MTSIIELSNCFTSLPRKYYLSQEVFDTEMERVLLRQWLYVGQVSQLSRVGDFLTRQFGTEGVVVTRGDDEVLRAFFNVCRHRGAQLCVADSSGNARRLVCPYHNWTYDLAGRLVGVPGATDGSEFHYRDWPLHEALVDTFYGGIWVWLGVASDAPSLASTLAPSVSNPALLARMQPERTKVAYQKTYHVKANWKLLLENNCECYHCAPAHPALAAVCDYAGFFAPSQHDRRPSADSDRHFPLRAGMKTFSMDGDWVCRRPLGCGLVPDTSVGYVNIPFFAGPVYFADHGVSLDLTPIDKDTTQLVSQWFVHEDAVEGDDYDETMTRIFDVTNEEDCALAELNQRGINSHRFVPGPNSTAREALIKVALDRYLSLMESPH